MSCKYANIIKIFAIWNRKEKGDIGKKKSKIMSYNDDNIIYNDKFNL